MGKWKTKKSFLKELEMTIDNIATKLGETRNRIEVRMLENEKGEKNLVLIQGNSRALKILGKMLLSISEENSPTDYCMEPKGAGSANFTSNSDVGIYFDKID